MDVRASQVSNGPKLFSQVKVGVFVWRIGTSLQNFNDDVEFIYCFPLLILQASRTSMAMRNDGYGFYSIQIQYLNSLFYNSILR